jgi:hypothetical protein
MLARAAPGVAVALMLAAPVVLAEPALQFVKLENSLTVNAGDKPVATYVWNDPRILRPYLTGLRTSGGVQVTRNHPPVEGQDPTDHAEMHPGVWLAFGDISGADFWRNKAAVRHVGFVESPLGDDTGGGFAVRNVYVVGEKTLADEICRVRIDIRPTGYLITWDSRFSGPEDFTFGDQEEMGLGIRVATPLTVKNGGRIVNSDGLVNEPQVWGKQAEWCDYSGTIGGTPLGMLLMADPQNFRRSWFHARDYGVLVANPFGQNAFTKGEKSQITVRPGESLRLRFGVLVHQGDTDLPAEYQHWVTTIGSKNE